MIVQNTITATSVAHASYFAFTCQFADNYIQLGQALKSITQS